MNHGNGQNEHHRDGTDGSTEAFEFRLNGETVRVEGVSPSVTLLDFLRGRGCKGTKEGCAEGDCGACSVAIVERDAAGTPRHRAINSCLALLPMVAGREVVSVEGVAGEKTQDSRSKLQGRCKVQAPRTGGEEAPLTEGSTNGATGSHEAAAETDPLANLHPVQRAMVERYGSQCGYCTPGFVVSMFEAYGRDDLTERWQVSDALSGNLCRCTGYRPIADAACAALCGRQKAEGGTQKGLTTKDTEDTETRKGERGGGVMALDYRAGGQRFLQPGTLEELVELRARYPEATLIAGATELGLEVNKKFHRFQMLISVGGVEELGRVERNRDGWSLGAAASLTKVEEALRADGADSTMAQANDALLKMIWVFGARPIRNRATLGGNLVNASPIGDMAPVLLALGAAVVLRSVGGERVVPLDEFFVGYRKTAMRADEALCAVRVPEMAGIAFEGKVSGLGGESGNSTRRGEEAKTREGREKGHDARFREHEAWQERGSGDGAGSLRGGSDEGLHGRVLVDSFKVSRRREMDISIVSAGFFVRMDDGDVVTQARLAFGGVAATTVRAQRAEAALLGKTWERETVEAVKAVLAEELTPINDVRGSAEYRRGLIVDLFEKFFVLDGAEEMPLDRRAIAPPPALPDVRTLPHESAVGHVTGAARYVDDGRVPQGMLETWPVCAPHARARILRRDAGAARRIPGVRAVLLAEDVPGENDVGAVRKDEVLLADKEVFFHGQLIALVVGESLEACRLAAAQVVVEYEPMAPLLTLREAVAAESFHTPPHRILRGDAEGVLRECAEVGSGEVGRRADAGVESGWGYAATGAVALQPDVALEGRRVHTATGAVALQPDGLAASPQNGTNGARRSPSTSRTDGKTEGGRKLTGEFAFGGQEHFYLEGQVAWAEPGDDGSMFVQSSTQHPSEIQAIVAHVLHVPKHRVVVQSPRMGGGFGGKETQGNTWAALAALAAHHTGRPARVRLNRDQDMMLTGKRHPFLARYEVGFAADGALRALKVELFSDAGWSLDLSTAITDRALFHLDNAYYIPNVEFSGRAVKTNVVSNTAFRGFGGPQGMLVMEEIIDRVARHLGLAPEAVRERNFYHGSGETNTTHYGQEIGDNRLLRVWSELKTSSRFEERRREEVAAWNAEHSGTKRGLAMTPVKFGISFTLSHLNQAGAHVLIYQDGSVQVNHGGTEMGQGLYTKMLAVAARELGLPPAQIRVMQTRTDQVPNTSPTAASSGSDLNGQAVRAACVTLRERLAPVAADLLGEPMEEAARLVFADGFVFHPARPERKLPFGEVTMKAYLARVSLAATGYYATPRIKYDHGSGRGTPFFYYVCGAAVAEVEVDGYTGAQKVRRVDILHDVGRVDQPGRGPGADRRGVHAGHGLADVRGVALGYHRQAADARAEHVQDSGVRGCAGRLARGVPDGRGGGKGHPREQGRGRAAADAGDLGAGGDPGCRGGVRRGRRGGVAVARDE